MLMGVHFLLDKWTLAYNNSVIDKWQEFFVLLKGRYDHPKLHQCRGSAHHATPDRATSENYVRAD